MVIASLTVQAKDSGQFDSQETGKDNVDSKGNKQKWFDFSSAVLAKLTLSESSLSFLKYYTSP